MAKISEKDKRYLEWKAERDEAKKTKTITLQDHECAIIIRDDANVETYLGIQREVRESELLALGLSWALEDKDWKTRVIRKARKKPISLCEKAGVATSATPDTQHD